MYVRISTDRTPSTNSRSEFGIANSSTPIASTEYTYQGGREIFGENEAAEWIYQVKSGAVRSYKLLLDGRRQIGAFHLVGDIFGLERGGFHRFTAEAVVETTVGLIRRRSLETVVSDDAMVACNLLRMISSNLEHAESHAVLLGRNTALEKVAAFLVEMDKRLTAAGIMALPMTRRDIADYLGLTIETVSRVLSHLQGAGVLDLCGKFHREIVVRDRLRLTSLDLPT